MGATVRELTELVAGRLVGDGNVIIAAATSIGEAGAGDITFAEDEHHGRLLKQSPASAAVVAHSVEPNGIPLIYVDDPLESFLKIVGHLRGTTGRRYVGIHSQACVSGTAVLGREVNVHPFARIADRAVIGDRAEIHSGVSIGEGCRLGDDVVLHPNVVLYPNTILGHRVVIHAGAVIGADGFGYRFRDGRHMKIPQFGQVEIGDDVEIGANTTIDRSTFSATRIGAGTKIDNLVQVGHNCQVGRHNILVAQAGLAGSCKLGDFVTVAGQAGLVDHVTVGDRAVIGAQAGVTHDVPADSRSLGSPATPESDQKRLIACQRSLPELRRRLRELEREVEELRKKS